MAMPQALSSPFNNKPTSLQSPIPAPTPTAEIPAGSIQMPPMEIQAGREPAADTSVPADFANFQPEAQAPAAAGDSAQVPSDFASYVPEDFNSFQAAAENVGGASGLYGVVQRGDGSFGVQESDGKVRELSGKEKKAASMIAEALRIGGPTLGALVGGGLASPSLAVPGIGEAAVGVAAGTGAVAGGDLVHQNAQFFEKLAGEKPKERGAFERTVEAVSGPVGGAIESSLVNSGLVKAGAESAGEAAANFAKSQPVAQEIAQMQAQTANPIAAEQAAGKQALESRARDRQQISSEANLPLRKDQINLEDPKITQTVNDLAGGKYGADQSQELLLQQAGQNQAIVDRFDSIRKAVGPVLTEEQKKNYSFKGVMNNIATAHEGDVAALKAKSHELARNTQVDATPLTEGMKSSLAKFGLLDQKGELFQSYPSEARTLVNKFLELQDMTKPSVSPGGFGQRGVMNGPPEARLLSPNEAGQASRGLTLKQLDSFVQTAQNNANFQGNNRTPIEKAWGEISHDARLLRDDAAAQAFDNAGDKNSAARLRAARDSYAENIDSIRQFQKDLEADPTNWAKALINKKDPQRVQQLVGILEPEQRQVLAGALLDEVAGARIDRSTARFGAKAMEKELASYDPKILDAMLGDERSSLTKLINYAKIVERRNLTSESVSSDPYVMKALAVIKHPEYEALHRGLNFISSLFSKKPVARDYILDQTVKQYPIDAAQGKIKKPSTPLSPAIPAATATGVTLRELMNQ